MSACGYTCESESKSECGCGCGVQGVNKGNESEKAGHERNATDLHQRKENGRKGGSN